MSESLLRRGAVFTLVSLLGGMAASTPHAFAKSAVPSDWATTAELCDRRLLTSPHDDKAWADLVEARLNLNDARRAEEALQIWRRNNPKARTAFPLIERLQGDLAYSRHRVKDAAEAWRVYTRLAPKDEAGWERLAGADEELGNLKGAIDAVGQALKTAPTAARYAWRARLKILLRDWSGAAADVKAGNKLDATDKQIQELLPKFERMSKWSPALKKLDAAVNSRSLFTNPADPGPLLDRSEFLAKEGWLGLAYEDACAALLRNPESLRAQYWKGVLAWELGRASEAGNVSKTNLAETTTAQMALVRKLDAEVDPEVRAHVLLELRQAVMALQQVEGIDGSVVKVSALVDLHRLPEAEAAAHRSVEVHPTNAEAWRALGWIELTDGNVKEALGCADRLVKLKSKEDAKALREEAEKRLGLK